MQYTTTTTIATNANKPTTKPIINPIDDFFYSDDSVPTTVTDDDVTVYVPNAPEESEVDRTEVAAAGSEVVAAPLTTVDPEIIEVNVIASTSVELRPKIVSRRPTI